MRNLLMLATLAMLLGACSKADEAPDQDDATRRARFIAAGMQAIAPKDLGNGLVMSGARADGETLIINFGGVDAAEFAIPDFDRQARQVVCSDSNFRGVLDKGVELVLAFKATTGAARSVRVASC